MIALANERGGEDNITVVIVQFEGSGLPPPPLDGVDLESLPRSAETPTELNWQIDAETEALTSEKVEALRPAGTEPLPEPPPSHFTKSQAEKPRPSAEFPRSPSSRPRTEPITSVFSAGEFDESYTAPKQPPVKNEATTRDPVLAAVTDSRPSTTSANDAPALSPTAPMTGVPPLKANPDSSLHSRQRHPLLIATYGLLAVLVAVLATYWYLTTQESKRREEERLANLQKKTVEQTAQKESMLRRLQDQIITVERSLVAADSSKNRDKREKIEEQLEKVKVRVEEVRQLSPDQMSDIREKLR